jgi:hypothetical protein
MKTAIRYPALLLLITLFACHPNRIRYKVPDHITDKTEQLSGKNIWVELNDSERIDGYTRIGSWIFGGEIACGIQPLKDIDAGSFTVCPGTKYAKDLHHVYYPLEIVCVDGEDCGVCYYAKIIVDSALPASFRYLAKDYATDGRHVFFRGELIQYADGSTFSVIEGPQYLFFAADKDHVYRYGSVFAEADAASFYFHAADARNDTGTHKYIIGDKDHEWEYIPPDQIKTIGKK